MHIPFLDLKQANAPHQDRIQAAFARVADSGWYILGNELQDFESNFAAFCGTNHAIGVGNGFDALSLILRAYDFPNDAEVIVPAHTFVASIWAVVHAGLKPVFVEPNTQTYTIDTAKIEAKITPKTVAILAVHLYGKCCEIEKIYTLAEKHHLRVIEDAAQAHGATYQGKKAGNLGDAAAFSFYPVKNLGAWGDGGAITTNDDALAEKLMNLRNYGFVKKNEALYLGFNTRLDEIQAAILNTKLPFLETENSRRRQIARRYLSEIKQENIVLPDDRTLENDAWHLFVVRTTHRNHLQNYLRQNGIETQIHYPVPPHRQRGFEILRAEKLPITEQLSQEILSIPLNAYLNDSEIGYIIDILNAYKI